MSDYQNLTIILHHKKDRLNRINLLDPSGEGRGKRVIAENVRSEAEATRIMACVNFCAGVSDSDLADGVASFGGLEAIVRYIPEQKKRLDELAAQRDELLAALKGLLHLYQNPLMIRSQETFLYGQQLYIAARDAIAKCEAQS